MNQQVYLTDSRSIDPGQLFISAFRERFDGHDYIDSAIERGAAAVISEKKLESKPVAGNYVTDSLRAYQDIAARYKESLALKRGVTGSVEKRAQKKWLPACFPRGIIP